ncbi:hypothetical protein E1293_02340 [Actinomadura darangshiensis]|uniref:Uncharacterized protein n=1 Tax=Actinomadura darangshiensis TaxID=705336 RepID=A0A4R5C0Z0_9ACTN|nr:DUF6292 family protein [Actinomadura darangshiensis]TDD91440.1 hypothetical protein E1293_02340 [Actinomadura darangshiensis]
MSVSLTLAHHPDPEVDTAHAYIACGVRAFEALGIRVDASWLDPKGPVDATIITGDNAHVWDEWTGWRTGTFVSGRQGERTVLKDARRLGGGVLLSPVALAELVDTDSDLPPATRSANARDGLFDALRTY